MRDHWHARACWNDHTGHINSLQKGVAYDPNDIARTTIKETNIDNDHTGHMPDHRYWETYSPEWNALFAAGEPTPNSQTGYMSHCHPWASGAAPWLTRHLIGLAPVSSLVLP